MGLFDIFRKKKRNVITDNSRENSVQVRQLNAEKRQLEHEIKILTMKQSLEEKKQDLIDMKNDFYGSDEDDTEEKDPMDKMMDVFMMNMMQKFSGNSTLPNTDTVTVNNNITPILEDVKILDILNNIPSGQRKMLKKMNLESFVTLARASFPGFGPETCKRGFELLQEM